MEEKRVSSPIAAANKFIEDRFPGCDAALLAGSVTRGEATETSDLDVVVFISDIRSAYRESLEFCGWPIEVFVHNLHTCREFFQNDISRARPSLPRMVAEGVIIRNGELLAEIMDEAKSIIEEGPAEWTQKEIEFKRYFITDTLDDFIGSNNKAEEIFIANELANQLHEFVLRTNKRWIGKSKWVVRELTRYDPEFTGRFIGAFDAYYKTGNKQIVIKLAEEILEEYGGRLFDGFSIR
ncbi:nucleotidyltransferase domain-containing protein [Bacillus sp. ISL-35]|uniref:nucleotidyltransferase domain-containing protein n=1 Tax=Bacillus sp. ISL-35 TaxID=2819122 RepID=UPI001BEBCBDB|nr:nucleotidyltransferase domain-containing protein [Bacillus sp. ISL-35]MBT2680944.1 nucleotidyltransferase domain-containing protein [Bacillus sp. ISL-35]MBT2705261.1 nucleotidyltransferase domain-containing protein [Chryseobacterium sp. ISL-80]